MEQANSKGQWGSRFGFLMAAVGSAVGLGNLWGFPYKMGKSGGFAFLIIYLILVFLVGVSIMLGELALGRKSGKGVISAYKSIASKYTIVGWFGWIAPLLILGFYCMLGGYCLKYMVANFGDIFGAGWGVGGADPKEYFVGFFTNQVETVIYTLVFVAMTLIIVRAGVSGGIEKFSSVAMPLLFFMLVGVIIRSVTLPGAVEGLKFMFVPDWSVFNGAGWITVLATAGGQVFFSLSLGMGIMITYGSYMHKNDDLQQSAVIIPMADTIIAIMAGLAIMPAVFASGLEANGGPGLIFITLQAVFQAMGSIGPIFGSIFYLLVLIAAVTSSISLLEAVVSAIMDKQIEDGKTPNRTAITVLVSVFVAVEGAFVAIDGLGANGLPQILGQSTWLDSFDLISEGLLMPIGALCMSIIFGWIKPDYLYKEIGNGSENFAMRSFFHICMKFIVPPAMLLVLAGQLNSFFNLGWF